MKNTFAHLAVAAAFLLIGLQSQAWESIYYPGSFVKKVYSNQGFEEFLISRGLEPRNEFDIWVDFGRGLDCQIQDLSNFGGDTLLRVYYTARDHKGTCEMSWFSRQGHISITLQK